MERIKTKTLTYHRLNKINGFLNIEHEQTPGKVTFNILFEKSVWDKDLKQVLSCFDHLHFAKVSYVRIDFNFSILEITLKGTN